MHRRRWVALRCLLEHSSNDDCIQHGCIQHSRAWDPLLEESPAEGRGFNCLEKKTTGASLIALTPQNPRLFLQLSHEYLWRALALCHSVSFEGIYNANKLTTSIDLVWSNATQDMLHAKLMPFASHFTLGGQDGWWHVMCSWGWKIRSVQFSEFCVTLQ